MLKVDCAAPQGLPGPTDVKAESPDISWISRLRRHILGRTAPSFITPIHIQQDMEFFAMHIFQANHKLLGCFKGDGSKQLDSALTLDQTLCMDAAN